jgi:peptide/nickel transport system ATP-binding protein
MIEPAKNLELLQVKGLSKRFVLDNSLFAWFKKAEKEQVQALNSLSFSLAAGETLGILGESGSGKSTLARVLMGIYQADAGEARLNGESVFAAWGAGQSQRLRMLKKMQMVFQDPYGSLDPRMTVRQIISEPLRIHGVAGKDTESLLVKTLHEVGLESDCLDRYPAEFSGGQRQRIGICRAVILNPELIIADEAVSALDVSVQAQILELLCRLRQERGLSMIFISHDVAVVRQISDRILLLYRGNLVEEMPADCLLTDAAHPYTRDLLASAKFLREGAAIDMKSVPAKNADVNLPGCCYRKVCAQAGEECSQIPPAREIHSGHRVFCWKAR